MKQGKKHIEKLRLLMFAKMKKKNQNISAEKERSATSQQNVIVKGWKGDGRGTRRGWRREGEGQGGKGERGDWSQGEEERMGYEGEVGIKGGGERGCLN